MLRKQTLSLDTWDCVEAVNRRRPGSNAQSAVSCKPFINRVSRLAVFLGNKRGWSQENLSCLSHVARFSVLLPRSR